MLYIILLCAMAIILIDIARKMYMNLVDAYVKSEGKLYINPLLHKAVAVGAFVTADNTSDAQKLMYMLFKHYPSGVIVSRPFFRTYIVYDPDHLKFILNHPHTLDRGPFDGFGEGWTNKGVLTSGYALWRPHRKALQSIFKLFDANVVVNVFSKHSLELLERLKKYDGGEELDCKITGPCIVAAVMEHVLGIQASYEESSKLIDIGERGGQHLIPRIYKVWLRPNFIFNFTKAGREHAKMRDFCNNYMRDIVEKRKKVLFASTTQSDENTTEGPPSMLDLMLKSDYNYPDDELLAELNGVTFAGFDTTAHLFIFLLYLVATHMDVQEKVYNELYEIYGNSHPKDNPTTADDLPKMEYMDRVIKESMRLFTPLSATMRRCLRPVTMGDIHMPAGSDVLVMLGYMHRNEKHWPNPLEFVPDRFLPDHPLGPRHPLAFVPFGHGPRNCIGSKYGMNATKTVLATLSRTYIFKAKNPIRPGDIQIANSIATIPRYPLMVSVERRVTSSK